MEIIDLPREHLADVAELTARAYADDPIFGTVFSTPRRHHAYQVLSTLMGLGTEMPGRQVRVCQEDGIVQAVAIWLTQGVTPGHSSPDGATRRRLGRLRRRIRPDLPRLARLEIALHATMLQEPGWFLGRLAVRPEQQRRGLGRALLHDGLARADAAQQQVHLQTSTPENVVFYERSGFTVVSRHELYPGCPPLWNLRRPVPAASGDGTGADPAGRVSTIG